MDVAGERAGGRNLLRAVRGIGPCTQFGPESAGTENWKWRES